MTIAVGAMVKASAAAAVITHLGNHSDFIHFATASISYVFQMQLLETASHESASATRGRDAAGAEQKISRLRRGFGSRVLGARGRSDHRRREDGVRPPR